MTDNKTNQCYQILILYEQKLISALSAAGSIGVAERQFFRIAKRFQDSGRNIEALKFQSPKQGHGMILEITALWALRRRQCAKN